MKKTFNTLICLILILVITACAPVDYSQQAASPEQMAEQKSNQALIYFYRTPGFVGSTYRVNVSESNQVFGAKANASRFNVHAEQ